MLDPLLVHGIGQRKSFPVSSIVSNKISCADCAEQTRCKLYSVRKRIYRIEKGTERSLTIVRILHRSPTTIPQQYYPVNNFEICFGK